MVSGPEARCCASKKVALKWAAQRKRETCRDKAGLTRVSGWLPTVEASKVLLPWRALVWAY